MDKKNILTYQGLQKLEDELQNLKVVRRKEVAQKIKEAREQGDLSENAEYHAAKEEQAMLHARIGDLEDKITRAVIVDDVDIDASKVYMGATVRVLNKKTRKEIVYHVVSPVETDGVGTEVPIDL